MFLSFSTSPACYVLSAARALLLALLDLSLLFLEGFAVDLFLLCTVWFVELPEAYR